MGRTSQCRCRPSRGPTDDRSPGLFRAWSERSAPFAIQPFLINFSFFDFVSSPGLSPAGVNSPGASYVKACGTLVRFSLVLAVLLVFAPTAQADIVANGSFEAPDAGTYYANYGFDMDIEGWTVGSGDVDHLGTYWQATEGIQSLNLNGGGSGSIRQGLVTETGQTYKLRFAYAGNADQGAGCPGEIVETSVIWDGALTCDRLRSYLWSVFERENRSRWPSLQVHVASPANEQR